MQNAWRSSFSRANQPVFRAKLHVSPHTHQSFLTFACVSDKRPQDGGGEELPRNADAAGEVAALLPDGGLHRAAEGRPGHGVVGGTVFICAVTSSSRWNRGGAERGQQM